MIQVTSTRGPVRPLSAVLAAFEDGATSLDEISERTGLDRGVVQSAVDHLRRMGRIEAKELAMGCPSGGCGSCASGTADGGAGCGSDGPSAQRTGPVLVQLSLRRP
ncbi:FeoC-like transcriptional regulator [Luteococcus sp. H138]|uniref:FeoC-like transcriptional regulator n=1 Tax=unclassified Luteococcus TaxID=2639923 RepID=UPI00313A9635